MDNGQFGGFPQDPFGDQPGQDSAYPDYSTPQQTNGVPDYAAQQDFNAPPPVSDLPVYNQPADYGVPIYGTVVDQEQESIAPCIVSMVFGIISIATCGYLGLLGIVGIICGVTGIKRSRGKGMAIAGIVTGSIGLVAGLFVCAAILIPTYIGYTKRANEVAGILLSFLS